MKSDQGDSQYAIISNFCNLESEHKMSSARMVTICTLNPLYLYDKNQCMSMLTFS